MLFPKENPDFFFNLSLKYNNLLHFWSDFDLLLVVLVNVNQFSKKDV